MRKKGLNKWSKYVEDVFAAVGNKDEEMLILEFLNKQYKNINFKIEHENNKKLSFLDTYIIRYVN